ncbi:MAG: THUMP domain-containing protein [Myxococcota bacterium]|jgi:putative N6-adenine-specific DNA methylase
MLRFFAASPRGIEHCTALELEAIGAKNVIEGHGGVHFEGDMPLLYRANLCLRTATRVELFLREFAAADKVMLYDQVHRMKWEKYIPAGGTMAVYCDIGARIQGKGIDHTGYAALKIKDAVVDRIRDETGSRPDVDKKEPDVLVHGFFNGTRCTLGLDSSDPGLHERGYRKADTGAPLKETLAAALVDLSGWDGVVPLIDPMCGSGTLVIEAAMKALGIAPGLKRKRFGFMHWPEFDRNAWAEELSQARSLVKKPVKPFIFAYDIDPNAVEIARANAKSAGVADAITFNCQPFDALLPVEGLPPGVILTNPPYGKRVAVDAGLSALYKMMGDTFKHKMKGWTAFLFTGNLEMAKHVGLRTSKRIELMNGPIECRLLRYEMF